MNTDIRKICRLSDRFLGRRLKPPRLTLALMTGLLLFVASVPASTMAQKASSGTSSRAAKKRAIDSLPYQHLTERAKKNLDQVLKSPSFYRKLPVSSIEADPEYLQFLIRHPEVIVNIWKLMGVTKMSCERTGPFSLKTNDGAGTISDLELMFGSQDLHIFYGHGTYEGSVIRRPLTGNCVLILRTSYQAGPSGTPIATNELDVFLKVENTTASLIAKTLQPLIGPTADHNFTESLKFVQRLNETTERNGPGVQKMADRFDVTPKVRDDFVRVAGNVFERSSYSSATRQPAVPAISVGYDRQPTASSWQNQPSNGNEGVYIDRAHSVRQYGIQPPVYQLGDRATRSGYLNR